jgi:hypothetical protein
MNKYEQLLHVSDPDEVIKRGRALGLQVFISTRKNKKYQVYNPHTDKWVSFGFLPYEDYTYHKDEVRRDRFRNRNRKWADAEPYTPAYLSYYLLW